MLLSEAVYYAELAVDAFHNYSSDTFFVSEVQIILARIKQAQGEQTGTLDLVRAILPQAQQMGWKQVEQEAEYIRSEAERELGHIKEAETAAQRALQLAQEMEQKEEAVKALLSLGQIHLIQKQSDEALKILYQAQRLSQEYGYADHFNKARVLLKGFV